MTTFTKRADTRVGPGLRPQAGYLKSIKQSGEVRLFSLFFVLSV
jgi:hypothetical protein